MRRIPLVVALSAMAAAPVAAQDAHLDAHVAEAMARHYRKYEPPTCGADKDLNYLVGSGRTYLKTGLETEIPENRARALQSGERVVLEAITLHGQQESGGAWYFLGRLYLQRGDVMGADSAFRKARELLPACGSDIDGYLRTAWVGLVNPAVEFIKANQPDSARPLLLRANSIYRAEPYAYIQLGTIAYSAGDKNTALAYFDSAAATTDTSKQSVDQRNRARYNEGVLLLQLGRAKDAVGPLSRVVRQMPDDQDAKKALYNAYTAAGMTDSAAVLAKELAAAGAPVQAPSAAADSNSPMSRATRAFQDSNWSVAASAAEQVVGTEPFNRDAWYILTWSYYKTKNGPGLVKAGREITKLDPANPTALQLLGFGYNLTQQLKPAVDTRIRLNALRFGVSGIKFAVTGAGATFTATATGRKAMDATGKPVAPRAATVTVDFLNGDGAVVASKAVPIPALAADETAPIVAEVEGAGISAWRYRVE